MVYKLAILGFQWVGVLLLTIDFKLVLPIFACSVRSATIFISKITSIVLFCDFSRSVSVNIGRFFTKILVSIIHCDTIFGRYVKIQDINITYVLKIGPALVLCLYNAHPKDSQHFLVINEFEEENYT